MSLKGTSEGSEEALARVLVLASGIGLCSTEGLFAV